MDASQPPAPRRRSTRPTELPIQRDVRSAVEIPAPRRASVPTAIPAPRRAR